MALRRQTPISRALSALSPLTKIILYCAEVNGVVYSAKEKKNLKQVTLIKVLGARGGPEVKPLADALDLLRLARNNLFHKRSWAKIDRERADAAVAFLKDYLAAIAATAVLQANVKDLLKVVRDQDPDETSENGEAEAEAEAEKKEEEEEEEQEEKKEEEEEEEEKEEGQAEEPSSPCGSLADRHTHDSFKALPARTSVLVKLIGVTSPGKSGMGRRPFNNQTARLKYERGNVLVFEVNGRNAHINKGNYEFELIGITQ